MLKVLSGIFLAFLIVGAMLVEQKRINKEAMAKQGAVLHKVNSAADELIRSCGRPQHETAMSSLSPQLTYDDYHLTIMVAFNSNPIFIDTETDNQIGREAAIHTMPCIAHWLSPQSSIQAHEQGITH